MKHLPKTVLILLFAASLHAQQTTFGNVKARLPDDKDHLLQDKGADLVLDDGARRLVVKCNAAPLDVAYGDVRKVIVELNTDGAKAGFGASFLGLMAGGLIFQGVIQESIDKPLDNDHFVYLEYKKPDGSPASYLLNVDKDSVPQVLKALQRALGERVQIPAFEDKREEVDKARFKSEFKDPRDMMKRVSIMGTARKHPVPELRPDKALVVVTLPATVLPQTRAEKTGLPSPLYADGALVSMTAPGTYTFFYLDPGEHILLSESWGDVVGLRMKLEAGKDYYLTQTLYPKGFRFHTFLTRHSRELGQYEVAGSLFAEWGFK